MAEAQPETEENRKGCCCSISNCSLQPGGHTSVRGDYTISKGHGCGSQPGSWSLPLSMTTHRLTGNRTHQVLTASRHFESLKEGKSPSVEDSGKTLSRSDVLLRLNDMHDQKHRGEEKVYFAYHSI